MTLVSVEQVGEVGRHCEVLRFQAHPSQVSACRHGVLGKLRAWKTPVRLEDVELLVSELVTNAILYGSPPAGVEACVVVELEETAEGLLVRVRNNGSEWKPEAADPTDLTESGRGLLLVGELAESWGHEIGQGGTSVYFVFRYLDAGSGVPPSGCLRHALYWGDRERIDLGTRIRRPMNSRDLQDHRTDVESRGSRT